MKSSKHDEYARDESVIETGIRDGLICPACYGWLIEWQHSPDDADLRWRECQECGYRWNYE